MRIETPWLEVLLDCPGIHACYTYAIPADLAIAIGDIVAVPLQQQVVAGVALQGVAALPVDLEAKAIRSVEDVLAPGLLPADYWPLLHHVAATTATPLAQVIRAALPPGLLGRSQRRLKVIQPPTLPTSPLANQVLAVFAAHKNDLAWTYLRRQLRGASVGLRELERQGCIERYWQDVKTTQPRYQQVVTLLAAAPDSLTARQHEILALLKRFGGELYLSELLSQTGASRSTIQTLARKGAVSLEARQVQRRLNLPAVDRDQALTLTSAQAAAVATLTAATEGTFLLQGVTGSGKTEVYLQVIAAVLLRHQSALVLVPEIGLTPQLTDRFRARFGDRVVVYHSGLSEGERYDTWRHLIQPQPQVIIGTRSAILAPIPQLGLIVLDEEHDSSYKQDQPQPCYHARSVAQWRSRQIPCPLILGSATPALETLTTATSQLKLPARVGDRPLPPVEIIDLREELRQGNRSVLSQPLQDALQKTQAQGEQTILFMPRRGHSTFVQCRSCGYVMMCPHCDVSLTFHQVGERLRCHYCGYHQGQPDQCPDCGSGYLKHFGSGTQRVVETLAQQFPDLRLLRFDRDSTRQKDGHRQILQRFRDREADVLVGTQMLTKGIDIANVTLVGVVAADPLLNQSDFRASERAFQILTQVAGRAGRGDKPGRVLIQTYLPDHPTLASVKTHNYDHFSESELSHRQASGYPPYRRLIAFHLSGSDASRVESAAFALTEQLPDLIPAEILGPCPAPIARIAGQTRWQLLLRELPDQAWDFVALAPIWEQLQTGTGVKLRLDIDPLNLG